jgi:hypothetical protein
MIWSTATRIPSLSTPARSQRPRALNARAALPITGVMSLEATLARVSAIRQALADPATLIASGEGVTGGTQVPAGAGAGTTAAGETAGAAQLGASSTSGAGASFASALEKAGGAYATDQGSTTGLESPTGVAGASSLYAPMFGSAQGSTGARIVAIAESQLGQTEQPPGSNESPAIATYRDATAGAMPGAPWCAYFASWVAREAGEPIGEGGQGAGAVSEVWAWAQRTGRAIVNGPGVVPKPGDLIVFGDEHVGIVRDVLPNGQIQTIEGNYENKVAANVRTPTEATGYVEMS